MYDNYANAVMIIFSISLQYPAGYVYTKVSPSSSVFSPSIYRRSIPSSHFLHTASSIYLVIYFFVTFVLLPFHSLLQEFYSYPSSSHVYMTLVQIYLFYLIQAALHLTHLTSSIFSPSLLHGSIPASSSASHTVPFLILSTPFIHFSPDHTWSVKISYIILHFSTLFMCPYHCNLDFPILFIKLV